MIANLATILIGLWLAYRAIFSVPAGEMSQIELAAAGVAVILLALWARRTDFMSWNSGTNIMLAATHSAAGCCAPRGWSGPAGLVLDDPAHRHHRGDCGDVVDLVSARDRSSAQALVRRRPPRECRGAGSSRRPAFSSLHCCDVPL